MKKKTIHLKLYAMSNWTIHSTFYYKLTNDIYLILIAFVSFRIFDIYKLYPANYAETMHGANGVIMDDVIAGIYSLIIVFIFKYLLSL